MGLAIAFLLFLVLDLHVCDFLLQVVHLFFQFLGLALQGADLVLHVFLLLLRLQRAPHAEGDRRFVERLVRLDGLRGEGVTDRISSLTRTSSSPRSAQLMVICLMSSSKHWL